ncbi:MAG: hypothetical protein WBV94_34665 [Blastocatellia bacterium]
MHTATSRNLLNFIELPSLKRLAGSQPAVGQGEFYQQIANLLVKGVYDSQLFCKVANIVIRLAHHAYTLRRADIIEQASQILLTLPLTPEYQSIGLYYYAISIEKQGRRAEACVLLERVAEKAPLHFRARATHLLGLFTHAQGDFNGAWSLYIEASRIAINDKCQDPQTIVNTQQNIAILKSLEGDHRRALNDLENLFPLVRVVGTSDPYKYYHFLNSYAVELSEVGRLDDAHNVCKIVLASPYAFAYPEWRETGNDIALRRYRPRSIRIKATPHRALKKNTVLRKNHNVLHLPMLNLERDNTPSKPAPLDSDRPAQVFDLQKWKEKMVKESNGDHKNNKSNKDMTQDEILYEIMNIFTESDMDLEIRLEMLESIQKLAAKKRAKKQEKDKDKDPDQD